MDNQNIDDISERELKFGYWWLSHLEDFKKILKIALIVIGAVFWLIVFYQLAIYLIGLPQDQQIIKGINSNVVDFTSFKARHQLAPLVFSEPQIIYTGNNRYDIVAAVANPNQDRGVKKLEYQFVADNFVTPTKTAVILPGQKVYLASLANINSYRLDSVSIKILNTAWQGLTEHFSYTQPLITVSDLEAAKDSATGRYTVDFKATNNQLSANYWQAEFIAVLWNQQRIVGVNQAETAEFTAGQVKQLSLSWFESLPRVERVEVIPMVNVYDPENYYEIPGAAQE